MKKQRLDILLVEKGFAASRERAKSLIMAGLVLVDNQKIDKAGTMVRQDLQITILGDNIGYVSRGGLKLSKAIQVFSLNLNGKIMADIGASTGGFTDCALQNGVKRVYAIDVGYGQLAWSLRTDNRVINMERTNIRNVTTQDIGELLDFITIDVAFISLDKVLPVVKQLLSPSGEIVALIKPQFEAGKDNVGKKGVVKDPIVHQSVIEKIYALGVDIGLSPVALTFSPVTGPEGNIEYLIYFANYPVASPLEIKDINGVIKSAHEDLYA